MTCDHYFAAIPWPQFAIAVLLGLIIGTAVGIYVERHLIVPRLVSLLHRSRNGKRSHE